MDKREFNRLKGQYFNILRQYVPIVARVHGGGHPEFLKVKEVFDIIAEKIQKAKGQEVELFDEFERLREITNGYKVPGDVCESYEAVYNMLEELDRAYRA